MDLLIQDLRYAWRTLRRQAGFSLTAILTLALGIGATTALFSVVNGVVLRPLSYEAPDRLVAVRSFWTKTQRVNATVSGADFADWRQQSSTIPAMAAYAAVETSVAARGAADYATVVSVTPGFFEVFRAQPQLGRMLTAEEQQPGGPPTVLISEAYWRRQFGARPDALGATVRFSQRAHTVAGVLPAGFRFPARGDVYVAMPTDLATTPRGAHNYRVVGRLADGLSVSAANAEMEAISRRLSAEHPNSNQDKSTKVDTLLDTIVGGTRATLLMLFGAVTVVLLIACANVANLLLARAAARQREMVVRAAVGAGRGRIARQLLTESVTLALAAGIVGILLAQAGVSAFVALAPADLPRLDEVGIDRAALGFALAVSLAASVIFGLAPALQLSGSGLAEGLRQGGKGSSVGSRGGWTRHAFVVAQIALAVVLVAGAGLLAKSLIALAQVDLGFDTDRLVVLSTAVPGSGRDDYERAGAFYHDVLGHIRAIPGVVAAGAVTGLPGAVRSNGGYWLQGGPGPDELGVASPQAIFTVVTPEYFRTLRVPIVRGRDFDDGDTADAPLVAIVNEALVRDSFQDRDPIGVTIRAGLDTLEPMTIVGVVSDVRTWGPSRSVQAEIYMAYRQHPGPASALNIVARAETAGPAVLADSIARMIRERNPDVPVRVSTMDDTLATATATPRFRTVLFIVFAVVALVLALAGVYGVMAFSVSRRVPEIGVRMALGASPRDVLSLVLREGVLLTLAGVVLGLAFTAAGARLVSGLLFGVSPGDPSVVAGVAVVVSLAALAACYVPGRRALRVDPTTALRTE